jgi:hypothetical protein
MPSNYVNCQVIYTVVITVVKLAAHALMNQQSPLQPTSHLISLSFHLSPVKIDAYT